MPNTKAKNPMATSILEKADVIINGDREKTYGDPGRNIRCIADFWNLYLNQKYDRGIHIKGEDVCAMMRFLKEARLINSPHDEDTLMDIAGYVGLAERIRIPKVMTAVGQNFERSEPATDKRGPHRDHPERTAPLSDWDDMTLLENQKQVRQEIDRRAVTKTLDGQREPLDLTQAGGQ